MLFSVTGLQCIVLSIALQAADLHSIVPVLVRYGALATAGASVFGLLSSEPIKWRIRKMLAGMIFGTTIGYLLEYYATIGQGWKESAALAVGLMVELAVRLFRNQFIIKFKSGDNEL